MKSPEQMQFINNINPNLFHRAFTKAMKRLLKQDIIVIDEPLPTPDSLQGIIHDQYAAANLEEPQ